MALRRAPARRTPRTRAPGSRARGLDLSRESRAARRRRAAAIARRLARAHPEARCALDHESPWQLLVATILSAQCTDAMVNRVTPELFAAWPTPEALASAPTERVEAAIHRTGFFRQKASAIQRMARAVVDEHGGRVPGTMEALTALPGVGRKTANVVLGTAFGCPAVFVDTHVRRLTIRLGLTTEDDPGKIEMDIQRLLPPRAWTAFAHRLIHHGRAVCVARRPRCTACVLDSLCPRVGVVSSA